MDVSPPDLRLSAQRALLGAIHPEIRMVKVKLAGGTIVMTAIVSEPLGAAASDALSVAATEIISDFPDLDIREEIIVSAGNLPREHILVEGWVYQRAED